MIRTHFQDAAFSKIHKPLTPEAYSASQRSSAPQNSTIVLDVGSYEARAGWADEADPRLVFRSLTGRPKNRKWADFISVGSEIPFDSQVRCAVCDPRD